MGRWFGFRTLLAIAGALVVLLTALAVVQYRWSTRVAAADTQREKEHLDSAAALFANQFDATVAQAVGFLQNEARAALESKTRLTGVPKLISQLYYIDAADRSHLKTTRLTSNGFFEPSGIPEAIARRGCSAFVTEQPAALVIPIYEITTAENRRPTGMRIVRTFSRGTARCFAGILDQSYLRDSLFPHLIQQSFGETTAKQYDFAVSSRNAPHHPVYGRPVRADVQKTFFSMSPLPPFLAKLPVPGGAESGKNTVFLQHMETAVLQGHTGALDLFGRGIWELDVAHKGLPLAAAFEKARQRDVLFSMTVESLLVTGIVFLMIGARRMQRLADQKMQFVAGVSHELRTPVSAIAMLSRNQADGLVAGHEKVVQYGELIHQQSRRLNDMVEQTLQYAGIQSGLRRPLKHEIDVRQLVEEATEAHREDMARRGFELELALEPDLPPVWGDASLLRIAFDNLLSNAQKYADAGRWIRVSAKYHVREKEVQISVEDRGAGIDQADQAEIFEPFSRGRAAIEAQIPGSGLGLSLVRSAAEAHRGSVTLVSEPGQGSTFTLHLPV